MNTTKVVTSLQRYKDAELSQKAQHIVDSLTGNTHFPTPVPALADVQTAVTAYNEALANAVDGSKQDTALKNQARDAVETMLNKLALYVQMNGNDDPAVMLSSGFDINKPKTHVGPLPKPEGFTVKAGEEKGSIDIDLDAIAGASGYQYEYADAPVTATSVWNVTTDTAAGITIRRLQSGKEYAFRAAGIGSDPSRVYSDVITSFVL